VQLREQRVLNDLDLVHVRAEQAGESRADVTGQGDTTAEADQAHGVAA
jgi:hypothetical protein